jgi:protein phosphatase PTC6
VATRAALAFLTAERALGLENPHSCGATASVVVMQALDTPQPPFFLSKKLALTVAHVGYDIELSVNMLILIAM